MKIPQIDLEMGMECYLTRTPGIDGQIRARIEDFIVEEIGEDGRIFEVGGSYGVNTEKRSRYLTFLLEKHDWDTFILLDFMSRELKIEPDRFSLGGIKDKRAITIQRVSVWGVEPEAIMSLRIPRVFIRGIWYSDEKIEPAKILGNRFRIKIRDARYRGNDLLRVINDAYIELLEYGGAPNFYGYQRFGTIRPINHKIGRKLIEGDIKGAVLSFLTETSEYEDEESKNVRLSMLATSNFDKLLNRIPKSMYYERLVVRVLARRPGAYVTALRSLPLNVRRMFIAAFASRIFNKIISRRIKNGTITQVLTGDLVTEIKDEYGTTFGKIIVASESNRKELQELVDRGSAMILLPVVGYKVPGDLKKLGESGEVIREVLDEEGVSPEQFKLRTLKELSFEGHLRAAIARITRFDKKLVLRDEDPKENTIHIQFCLPRGSFATVVLREFMKPEDPIRAGF